MTVGTAAAWGRDHCGRRGVNDCSQMPLVVKDPKGNTGEQKDRLNGQQLPGRACHEKWWA